MFSQICADDYSRSIVRNTDEGLHKRKMLETEARSVVKSMSAKQQKLQQNEQGLTQEIEDLQKAVQIKTETLTRVKADSLTVQQEKATAEKTVRECEETIRQYHALQNYLREEKFGQLPEDS